MSHYTVKAERSGKWWALQCVEVPGAISQVARLDQAAETIREAIAWVAGVPEEEVEIEVVPVLPESTKRRLEASERLRQESARLNSEAAEQTRAAVGELHEVLSLTYREIGSLLKISHQRAAQLATEAKETNATTLPVPESVDLLGVAEFSEMEIPGLVSTLREPKIFREFLARMMHRPDSMTEPSQATDTQTQDGREILWDPSQGMQSQCSVHEASKFLIESGKFLAPMMLSESGNGIKVAIFTDHRPDTGEISALIDDADKSEIQASWELIGPLGLSGHNIPRVRETKARG